MLLKRKKIFTNLLILLAIFTLMIGCSSDEEKARKMHNEAIATQRAGDSEKATEFYNKIVERFPATETAVKVNEKLAASEALAGFLSDSEKEIRKFSIEMALKLYKLDNGRYPSTEQGLQALVEKPSTGKIPRNWRLGGYLEDPSIIDLVDSYSRSSDGFDFTVIMK